MRLIPTKSFLRTAFKACCVTLVAGSLSISATATQKQKKSKKYDGPQWFDNFKYGPAIGTVTGLPNGIVVKSQAIKVGGGAHTVIYDTEMMSFNGAFAGSIKFEGTPWNGRHGGAPKAPGNMTLQSDIGPGWAKDGSFKDPRKFGPLPKHWVKYKGQYRNGENVVLTYTVGNTSVLEMPAFEDGAFTRTINIDKAAEKMTVMIARGQKFPVKVVGSGITVRTDKDGNIVGDIAAGASVNAKIVMGNDAAKVTAPADLTAHTKGGPLQWAETFDVKGIKASVNGPYATEEIPLPEKNPWDSRIRFSGFDFFADGTRAAICSWNGDVWIASGIDKDLEKVTWKRYAAGLFETLGLKIVDDVIYVTGKDQITRLHDINKDGEADFYENFNNDIKITQNFHEFTFGLQTDKEGNFYFSKGAPVRGGGRGFDTTHEHHGIVLKVSKDGQSSEVVGNGLRAPGGIGIGPNGEVTTGENEGTYVPACKINWVTPGSFSGVIHPGNGRTMEQGYDKPLCWLPMQVDNSGGGQVWVDSDQWGPFNGEMLHLSYGRSTVYKVMRQEVNGVMQGGVVALPIKLASSAMRGRFNPVDKQLYVAGFRGWQTNAAKESGLQRIRYTGKDVSLPTELKATKKGVYITFTQKLDKELAEDIGSYSIKWWNYVWGPMYGSAHFSVNNPDKEAIAKALVSETKAGGTKGQDVKAAAFKGDDVPVKSAKLLEDGKTVFLEISNIRDVMQMEIALDLETVDGDIIISKIYNSIHNLEDDK
ncbi:MAG: hypothetical protein MK132_17595 [Lentisphaerales bacterium]|nr:hypothetical protein [Lentisphaerales bacterium]